jgi:pentatricopeptide repeat protein
VRDGQLGRARTILSWLGDDANPLRPDVWAYTALLRGLLADSGGGARRVDEALALLDEMLKLGVSPNEATVSTLITGCFDRGNVSAAREAADTVRTHASHVGDARLALATDEAMIVGLCRPRQPTSAADDASHQVSLPLDTGRARDPQRLRDALRLFVSCQSSSVSRGNSVSRSPNGGGASSGASSSSSSSSASSSANSSSSGQKSDAYAAANGSADGLRLGTRTCNALLAALVASGEVSSATHVLLSDAIASDDLE